MGGCLNHHAPGFSLLEIMIALTVFTIGILAVASLSVSSMNAFSAAQATVCDSLSAGKHIEDVLSRPYADPILEDTDHDHAPTPPDHGPYAIGDGRSTIEWEVDDDFPVPGTKRISMTVRRTERGRVRKVVYEYVKAKDFR